MIGPLFWRRVAKSSLSGCWEWTGARTSFGHGVWRKKRAHRLSYEDANGPIPDGLCVCHHCDNPPCVNPAHLFLGTRADNNLDAKRKGRSRAVARPQKLTAQQVLEIRASEKSSRELARIYPVSDAMIRYIRRGESHKSFHDGSAVKAVRAPRGESCKQSKVTAQTVIAIRRRYANGESSYSIARDFALNPSTAWDIAVGNTWRHIS